MASHHRAWQVSMIFNSFLHLPGIGKKKEQALWSAGVGTWDEFEKRLLSQPNLFKDVGNSPLEVALRKSRAALAQRQFDYFADLLPSSEHYRIALSAPESTAFLDLETTGLSHYYDTITIIGVSRSQRYHCYIKGQSVREAASLLSSAKCIVTFNGTLFDLKFLAREFPDIPLPKAHVDLRFLARAAGAAGGQKKVEVDFGIRRPTEVRELSGRHAPVLWYEYTHGVLEAAETLVRYNHADVEGLKSLLDHALQIFRRRGAIPSHIALPHFSSGKSEINFDRSITPSGNNVVSITPYVGAVGSRITLKELNATLNLEKLRIAGIDLTGSERRPTGWSLLTGNVATTAMISTDDDIYKRTLDANPDLVSIDSPLSLPAGRTRVTDDDPMREEIGIMRQCERILKQRGVNVYPSLIPSMQKLTARGIRLAQRFREAGIPVIESYPGAAQDIMGILRKRASLPHLAKGLSDFGIEGEFTHVKISHDELDAITAAVVGQFFWAGRFEALGNEAEEYLIIPDLRITPKLWIDRVVIGVSGAIAAGKTTASRHLEQDGFAYGRYSAVLAELLLEQRRAVDRGSLQEIGERVHVDPGQRWLSKRLASKMVGNARIVVDGIRFPEDHAYLVEKFGPRFFHIHITAPPRVRERRYSRTGASKSDFKKASMHSVEQQIPRLSTLAHSVIANDSSKVMFLKKIDAAIAVFGPLKGER